jgi:hypothetical protein
MTWASEIAANRRKEEDAGEGGGGEKTPNYQRQSRRVASERGARERLTEVEPTES